MSVGDHGGWQRDLTVARVREQPTLDFVEVMFLESPRIFHLAKSHGRFEQLLTRLRDAERSGQISRVTVESRESGNIIDVERSPA